MEHEHVADAKLSIGQLPNEEAREILNSFTSSVRGKRKRPKREYVRVKIIRGFKKTIRSILRDRAARVHRTEWTRATWLMLCSFVHEKSSKFEEVADTASGPLTDGKSKRTGECGQVARSFNNQFCTAFFQDPDVREAFNYYTQWMFSIDDPADLVNRFILRCCSKPVHTIECNLKWLRLKYFFNHLMLAELGLDPAKPKQLPSLSKSILPVNKFTSQ